MHLLKLLNQNASMSLQGSSMKYVTFQHLYPVSINITDSVPAKVTAVT